MLTNRCSRPIPIFKMALWILILVLGGVGTAFTQERLPSWWPPHQSPKDFGEYLLVRKQPEKALKAFIQAWNDDSRDSYSIRGVVRAYKAMDKLNEARGWLEANLLEHPDSSSLRYGLGYLAWLLDQFDESDSLFRQALEKDPQNALAMNNLGAVLVALKKPDKAIEWVGKAIVANPDEPMFYINLARIYSDIGQPERFLKDYKNYLNRKEMKIAKGYGRVITRKLRQESFRLYSNGDIQGAISKNSDMLTLYEEINHLPGKVSSLFSLAVLYEELGDMKKTRHYYREVLKINPQHIQARQRMEVLEGENK